jgi:proteasome lid subunit RPN8/RPN11
MAAPGPRLRLRGELGGLLRTWAQAAYPFEACGLLLGEQTADGPRVDQVRVERNIHETRARDRYELDPAGFMRAQREADALGLDIVGVWHTHPGQSAAPSEFDRVQAWSGWSYVILSVIAGRVADCRSWRLQDAQFVEELICDA